MTIAGFTFTKLLAEKKAAARGNININTNMSFISAEEIDFVMGTNKQKGLKVSFDYRNTYVPDIGTLIINGEILYLSDQKRHDELMKSWKKDKRFPDDVTAHLYDMISVRSTVEAISLSSTVGLPPPVPVPRFTAGKKQEQQESQQQKEQKGRK
ncbi:hypothetical protein HYY73_03420 [Candidatus Woesearchaeota archaeon]|nr:hypothetical protein [Candidatus Woesearchaeota archaeon]